MEVVDNKSRARQDYREYAVFAGDFDCLEKVYDTVSVVSCSPAVTVIDASLRKWLL